MKKAPNSGTNAERGPNKIGSSNPILGYAIGLRNGILAPSHVSRIAVAIWVLLWLIDKQTTPAGLVLGGAPVTTEQISIDLGLNERKVRRDLKRLASAKPPYISITRRCRGLSIRINKPKKRWERSAATGSETGQNCPTAWPKLADLKDKTSTTTKDSPFLRRLEALG